MKICQILFIVKSYKTWPKGSLGGDLQRDVTLGDLDWRSRSQPLLESQKMPIFLPLLTISQTVFIGSEVMKVGFQLAYGETFIKM